MSEFALPEGFDAVDLGELLAIIGRLLDYSRYCTFDEDEGEAEVAHRAMAILERYKLKGVGV